MARKIEAESWKAAENYLRLVMEGMRQMNALPMCVIVQRMVEGPAALIASDFPTEVLPTIEEWMELYPGRKEGRSFRLTVKPPEGRGRDQ